MPSRNGLFIFIDIDDFCWDLAGGGIDEEVEEHDGEDGADKGADMAEDDGSGC